MAWYYLYETATGRLHTETSNDWEVDNAARIARGLSPLPASLGILTRATRANGGLVWDPATRNFIARPAKILADRLNDIRDQAGLPAGVVTLLTTLINRVPSAQRANARNELRLILRWLLGPMRYRNQAESVSLGAETSEA